LIFVCGGGEGQALLASQDDGKIAWKSESDKMTHATPTLATIHGVRQVIFFTQSGLVQRRPGREKSCGVIRSGSMFPRRRRQWSPGSGLLLGRLRRWRGLAKVTKDISGFKATEVWRKQ